MNDIVIPETKVLGFTLDSLLTWEPYISNMLCHAKQRAGQLYCCCSLLSEQMYALYINPGFV